MPIELERACALVKEHIHDRPAGTGRAAGKLAVVTGAAQGFGRAIAEMLVREGAAVAVVDLNGEKAAETAAALGSRAIALQADVGHEESVRALFCAAAEKLGGIDLLVSNAGIVRSAPLAEMKLGDFAAVASVNYIGYFLCAKYAAILMEAQHAADPEWRGDIVNINSKSGLEGSSRNAAYAGSKFGAIGLTQSFALELCAYNIKVNSVCPGNFLDGPLWSDPENGLFVQYLRAGKVPGARTVEDVRRYYEDKVPMKRGCRPEDVNRAVLYCIEQAYETGQAIPVTGGQVMLG